MLFVFQPYMPPIEPLISQDESPPGSVAKCNECIGSGCCADNVTTADLVCLMSAAAKSSEGALKNEKVNRWTHRKQTQSLFECRSSNNFVS
jgi:hypothetical protein